jgi:hypothetical protein
VSESTNLADRNATRVLADRPTMNLVAEAISTAKGLDFLSALDAYQTRLEQLGPQATLQAVLGTDAGEVLPLVKLRQVHQGAKQKLLDDAIITGGEGTAQVLRGRVMLAPDADVGVMLGNKEEFERRLQRMRAARVDGTFHGDKGREHFRRVDREGLEQGWDPVATAEYEAGVRQARARARAEAAAMQAPLTEVQAARQEQLRLEQAVRTLDSGIAHLEAQRPELRRRGLSEVQVKHKIGLALAEKHELTKRLEQAQNNNALQLDSIPGYTFIAEQPETEGKKLLEKVWTREETEALQREVNVARVYRLEHPEVDVLTSLEMAHEGKITLDGASEAERR